MGLLLLHATATLIMFGVILVVQFVHYPLFRYVGTSTYDTYQAGHVRRMSWVVAPAMTIECVTAVLLVLRPPDGVASGTVWAGLALVALLWITTALVHVPLHRRLSEGFDATLHQQLVRTNWIRTGGWTVRAGLVVWMLAP